MPAVTVGVALLVAQAAMAAPPSNDMFSAAEDLTGSTDAAAGTNREASREAGEPNHAGNAGGASVWYSWTAPSSGTAVVDTCLSSFDTLLAVYEGSTVDTLATVASNNDTAGCGTGNRSRVRFAAEAGTTYRIAVDGSRADVGDVALSLELRDSPPNDAFANAEELTGVLAAATGSNRDATKEFGEPNHAGSAGGASVWYRWTAPSSGTAVIDTCSSSFDTLLAVYEGSTVDTLATVASNDDTDGCGVDRQSRVRLAAEAGTTYRIAVDGFRGASDAAVGDVALSLELRDPPPNDAFTSPERLEGQAVTATGDNRNASKQIGEPNHAGSVGGASVWYRWTAPSTGRVTIDTCASGFDTVLAVYEGSSLSDLTPVASANDSAACGNGSSRSHATFGAVEGTSYRIVVDGWSGGSSTVRTGDIVLEIGSAPVNTARPETSGTAREGEVLTASDGTWAGTEPMTLQRRWQRCDASGGDCSRIGGATGPEYVVTGDDVGHRLRVVVDAVNEHGTTSAASQSVLAETQPPPSVAPSNEQPPSIAGAAIEGEQLTASNGTWTGTEPIGFTHQWRRCDSAGTGCAAIAGATAQTYDLVAADVGSRIVVRVTGTNTAGSSSAHSAPTAIVEAPPPPATAPANTSRPKITGTARVGQGLTASPGSWTGTKPIRFSYRWQRCNAKGKQCRTIAGATTRGYKLKKADRGRRLRVVVTARNSAGRRTAVSAPSKVVR